MSGIGLIINDKSNRSASIIGDLVNVARQFSSVRTEVLDGIHGLDKALIGMNNNNVDTLIVAGGDGTLQATFTDMINNNRFDATPHYVALPCGMTNVIANDCGLKGSPVESLDKFLWRRQEGTVKPINRALMTVKTGDQVPIHGFFLGAAAFYSAVQFSRNDIQAKGAKRSLALITSVLSYIVKVASDPNGTFDPVEMTFLGGAPEELPADMLSALFMATTLSKLGSGIFPFWGEGDGAMTTTTVEYPIKKILRAAPSVLRGKSRPWFGEAGYHSWRSDQLTVRFDGPFIFDGELFHADHTKPTIFETTQKVNFLN